MSTLEQRTLYGADATRAIEAYRAVWLATQAVQ